MPPYSFKPSMSIRAKKIMQIVYIPIFFKSYIRGGGIVEKQNKSKKIGEKYDSMEAMDQGTNLIAQVINNATGLDEGNDGEKTNKK